MSNPAPSARPIETRQEGAERRFFLEDREVRRGDSLELWASGRWFAGRFEAPHPQDPHPWLAVRLEPDGREVRFPLSANFGCRWA